MDYINFYLSNILISLGDLLGVFNKITLVYILKQNDIISR